MLHYIASWSSALICALHALCLISLPVNFACPESAIKLSESEFPGGLISHIGSSLIYIIAEISYLRSVIMLCVTPLNIKYSHLYLSVSPEEPMCHAIYPAHTGRQLFKMNGIRDI